MMVQPEAAPTPARAGAELPELRNFPAPQTSRVYGSHLHCSWLLTEIYDQLMKLLPGSWTGLAPQPFF